MDASLQPPNPEQWAVPKHEEEFEVVCLKRTASQLTALPEDFKRIPVTAAGPLDAMMSEKVEAEKDYMPLFSAKPGVPTDPEIMARRRLMEGPVQDRSKI